MCFTVHIEELSCSWWHSTKCDLVLNDVPWYDLVQFEVTMHDLVHYGVPKYEQFILTWYNVPRLQDHNG